MTILNETYCEYYTLFYNASWDSQICAGEIKGGKDTCQGIQIKNYFLNEF